MEQSHRSGKGIHRHQNWSKIEIRPSWQAAKERLTSNGGRQPGVARAHPKHKQSRVGRWKGVYFLALATADPFAALREVHILVLERIPL